VCVLLLVFAATLAGSFWVDIIRNAMLETDPYASVMEPEWYRFTKGGYNYDFFQYYAGGHNWSQGLDPYLNHPDEASAIQNPRHEDKSVSGYIYPPTWLPLFAAFARMQYGQARQAWFVLNVGLFALLVGVAVLTSPGRRLEVSTAAVLLTLCSYPFLYHAHLGQIDLIVAALAVGAFLVYPRWHGWPTALLLAIAISVKITPIVLVAVMVAYFRDLRLALRTLVCLLAVGLVSFLAVSPHLYWEYVADILPRISVSSPSRFNQTLMRFWTPWPQMLRVFSLLGYAALVFLAYVCGKAPVSRSPEQARVDTRTETLGILALAVTMTLIFSPLGWLSAYVMTIVPMALLLTAPPPRDAPWAMVVLAAGTGLMCMRIFDVQVLNLLNALGAAVVVLCLLYFYLPLRAFSEASALQEPAGPEG
jgi:hypothetical protein